MLLVLLCAAFLGSRPASGLSTGPPLSVCGSMNPQGHIDSGFQPQNLDFSVSASSLGSGQFGITVSGTQTFKGVFIQVRDSMNNAVGTFSAAGLNGFQTRPCFGRDDSAFSHSNGDDKGSSVTATWTAPSTPCEGDLTIRATVVVNFVTFQVGITEPLPCPATTEEPPPPPITTTEEEPPPPPITTEEPPPPPPTTTEEEPPPPPVTTEEPPPPPATTEEEPPPPPPATTEEEPPPPPPITTEEPPPPPPATTEEEPPPQPITTEEPPSPPIATEEPPPPPITTEEPPPPPITTEEPPPPPITTEEPPPPTTTTEEPSPAPATTEENPIQVPTSLPKMGCRYSANTSVPSNKYSSGFESTSLGGWRIAGRKNYRNVFRRFHWFRPGGFRLPRQPMWMQHKGLTPSRGTGPQSAADGKYYMYLEASEPMGQGDKVSLHTDRDLRGCFCLQFYHHHNVHLFRKPYDQHKLSVFAGFRKEKLRRVMPHDSWRKVSVQFDEKYYTMVRIVGTRGKDWRGDMAIDKVSITEGMCPY